MAGARTKFLTLINSLPVSFPDNATGQITPAILRDFLDSMLRTCFIPDASLTQTVGGLVVPLLNNTWTVVPVALWGVAQVDASGDITASVLTGRLTGNPTIAGLDYGVHGDITISGVINTEVNIGFFKSGVAPAFQSGTMTLGGAGKDVTASLGALFQGQATGTYWELGLRLTSGAASITIENALIDLNLLNTWS